MLPPLILATALAGVAHLESTAGNVCAGALIAPDLILTAWHCVSTVRPVAVTWKDGKDERTGEVVASDAAHDVAVLKLDAPVKRKPLPIAPLGKLVAGAPLTAIGHPYNKVWTVTEGKAVKPDKQYFLFDAEVKPGNSGGPVLNAQGQIEGVAIVLNRLVGDREIGDAVGVEPIEAVVKAAAPRRPLTWRAAAGKFGIQLGAGRDSLLDALAPGADYASFQYEFIYDWHDRVRFGFEHLIMRPQRTYAFIAGYAFKELPLKPALLLGRGFYDGPHHTIAANKIGAALTLFGFETELFSTQYAQKRYWSWALTL
jgi:hypothetical protein